MGGYYTSPQPGEVCRYCGQPLLFNDKCCCNSVCAYTELEEKYEELKEKARAVVSTYFDHPETIEAHDEEYRAMLALREAVK